MRIYPCQYCGREFEITGRELKPGQKINWASNQCEPCGGKITNPTFWFEWDRQAEKLVKSHWPESMEEFRKQPLQGARRLNELLREARSSLYIRISGTTENPAFTTFTA